MSNYTCYRNYFQEEYEQLPFEKRYNKIIDNQEFFGLSSLNYKGEELIKDNISYNTVLDKKRNYFLNTKNKRVFISHKMEDKHIAINFAKKLHLKGVSYWLDVLDPQLSNIKNIPSNIKAIRIANIIEMALLNCSIVVAIMTNNSFRSQWIPYEYGRVKERKIQVENAFAFNTSKMTNPIPEYMYLGKVFSNESSLITEIENI